LYSLYFYIIFLGKLEIFLIREINWYNHKQHINDDGLGLISLFISLIQEYKKVGLWRSSLLPIWTASYMLIFMTTIFCSLKLRISLRFERINRYISKRIYFLKKLIRKLFLDFSSLLLLFYLLFKYYFASSSNKM
jgi:hypothetical protein